MSNEVQVEYGDSAKETATLLLAAAEESEQDASVVRTGNGVFYVPEDVAKKAGVEYGDKTRIGQPRHGENQPRQEEDQSNSPDASDSDEAPTKAPAKKSAAKKATAKKSAAKKSTAKKS